MTQAKIENELTPLGKWVTGCAIPKKENEK
jgi:hypothetical protein